MSLHNVNLRVLACPVPTGSEQLSLGAILQLFSQTGSDRLVLLDEQQHPTGLVRLSRVLPIVLDAVLEERFLAIPNSQKPLHQTHPAVIEPILTALDTWTLQQLVSSLHLSSSQNSAFPAYAVVNQDGEFGGLLSYDRLLHHLAEPLTAASQHNAPQQQITQLTQQLLAQRAELEQRIKTQQVEITSLRQEQDRGSTPYSRLWLALPCRLTSIWLLCCSY